jgi:hypothetical protein
MTKIEVPLGAVSTMTGCTITGGLHLRMQREDGVWEERIWPAPEQKKASRGSTKRPQLS